MGTEEIDTGKVREIALKHLRTFPIFGFCHVVDVEKDPKGGFFLTYSDGGSVGGDLKEDTRFELKIKGDTCYGTWINLRKEFRGRGLGARLYQIVEDISRDLGCKRIEQEASGVTITGETRKDYTIRKLGYISRGSSPISLEKVLN